MKSKKTTAPTTNIPTKTIPSIIGKKDLTSAQRQTMISNIMTNAIHFGQFLLANVDIRLMAIDDSYQRMTTSKLKNLIDDFNLNYMDPVILSLRSVNPDNVFYVTDGQHRSTAAAVNGIMEIPCIIHTGLSQSDEAKMFQKTNSLKSKLSPYNMYKAGLVAKDPVAVALYNVCQKFQLTVTPNNRKAVGMTLSAVGTATDIIQNPSFNGIACLTWILDTFKKGKWLNYRKATSDRFLNGMCNIWMIGKHDNTLDLFEDNLIPIFRNNSVDIIEAFASMKYQADYRRNLKESLLSFANGEYSQADIDLMMDEASKLAA